MSVQTFGVVQSTIENEFQGLSLSDFSSSIEAWVTQYGAVVEAYLRRAGYDPADVAGYGTGDSLYQLCATYVTLRTAARLAGSSTMQSSELAESHLKEAGEIERLLRNLPEAVTEEWDADEQGGSFRTSRKLSTAPSSARKPRFYRGMRS